MLRRTANKLLINRPAAVITTTMTVRRDNRVAQRHRKTASPAINNASVKERIIVTTTGLFCPEAEAEKQLSEVGIHCGKADKEL